MQYSKLLKSLYLYIKFYIYWYFADLAIRSYTVVKMFITREERLYYMYSTGELIKINASNYWSRVRVDNTEFALIKTVTPTGTSYTKGERF